MRTKVFTLFALGLLLVSIPLAADEWNKKTTVVFSAPYELPGVTLPAGTYVFKLAETTTYRHVIQVFDKNEMHLYATILAIPNYRLTPTANTVMPFAERPAGTPQALRAWFYPGDNFGQEFVYPKARAVALATATQQPVLTAPVEPTQAPQEIVKAPVVAVTPEKKEIEVAQAAPPPAAAPVEIAQATPAPAPALPATASLLPLLAVVGVCAMSLATILRAARRVRT